MEDGQESDLWQVRPHEKVRENEEREEQAGYQPRSKERVEKRMGGKIVNALEILISSMRSDKCYYLERIHPRGIVEDSERP